MVIIKDKYWHCLLLNNIGTMSGSAAKKMYDVVNKAEFTHAEVSQIIMFIKNKMPVGLTDILSVNMADKFDQYGEDGTPVYQFVDMEFVADLVAYLDTRPYSEVSPLKFLMKNPDQYITDMAVVKILQYMWFVMPINESTDLISRFDQSLKRFNAVQNGESVTDETANEE